MCWYELHPPGLINAATLPCESRKRKCMWTQLQLLMLTTKQPLYASNYIDSFIRCSVELYKWTFMSQHVFEVSTTSMHTWSQMVTPASIIFWSKSKQVYIKRFRKSSMSWIFDSYTLCSITPQISKYKAHDEAGPLWWRYDTSDAIIFGNIPL